MAIILLTIFSSIFSCRKLLYFDWNCTGLCSWWPADNKSPLVQVITWRRKGARPLLKIMMIQITDASPGLHALIITSLQWRHDGRDCVSNHQPHDRYSIVYSGTDKKKTSKLRVTGLCVGMAPLWPWPKVTVVASISKNLFVCTIK